MGITADLLLEKLKAKILAKLEEEAYTDDQGVYHDPVSAKDLAQLGMFVLKLYELEERQRNVSEGKMKVIPIPALPPIQ